MNKRPSSVEENKPDPTIDGLQQALEKLDWVRRARVRLREDGDVLTGEAYVEVQNSQDLLARLDAARELAVKCDWRLHDVTIVPVRTLD